MQRSAPARTASHAPARVRKPPAGAVATVTDAPVPAPDPTPTPAPSSEVVSAPERLPPPNVLKHRDLSITFAPGARKTAGSQAAQRFARYRNARTTREFFALGGRNADWLWDIAHGLVRFGDDDMNRLVRNMLAVRTGSRGRKTQQHNSFASLLSSVHCVNTDPAYSTYMTDVKNAAAAHALQLLTYDDNYNMDIASMSETYKLMQGHKPTELCLVGEDVTDEYLDYALLHSDTIEEIYLQTTRGDHKSDDSPLNADNDNLGITIDEELLVSLKGMTPELKQRYIRSIHKELKDLCRVGTWQLEPLPDGRKTIGSKLVHKTKYRADGSFDKDKSRLVALGFLERAGIDFHATYSPMASLTAVRLVLSLAVHNSLPIYHADVPQAFLRADLDTEVYLTLPKGIND